MGNNGSFMEKVYIYLPVLMCHSKMDYQDAVTMRNIRMAYGLEQVLVFAFTAYFVFIIRRKDEKRRILVPNLSKKELFMNNAPPPDQLTYRPTTYFHHEMTEVFQQLQQVFFALMFTILVHFIIGIKPVLLLQIFSTPYHFIENRLFRKHVLGLKPGYRVWGERFDGEVEADRVKEDAEGDALEDTGATTTTSKASATLVEGVGASAKENAAATNESSVGVVVGTEVDEVDGSVPVADATIAEVTGEPVERGDLPMPKALEDALIDAWDAAEDADWGKVVEQVGNFSVNTHTPVGGWTPLMVACGLTKVGEQEIKYLICDMEADVSLRDDEGWTCIHWTAQNGRAEAARAVFDGVREMSSEPSAAAAMIAELLTVTDKEGKTAEDVAKSSGFEAGKLKAFLDVLRSEVSGEEGQREDANGDLAELD